MRRREGGRQEGGRGGAGGAEEGRVVVHPGESTRGEVGKRNGEFMKPSLLDCAEKFGCI